MKLRAALVALIVGLSAVAVTSCGKKEESVQNKTPKSSTELAPKPLTSLQKGKNQLPPGHPPINREMPPGHPSLEKDLMAIHSGKVLTKFDKPIKIPEEVTKTWKSATLDIIDKTSGKKVKEFKVHNGETVKYGGLEIKVLYIVPHLVFDNGYTSGSNEPQNPAVLVEVKENGKTIYAGPIYQKFPRMYNINHPRYVLILKGISKKG